MADWWSVNLEAMTNRLTACVCRAMLSVLRLRFRSPWRGERQ